MRRALSNLTCPQPFPSDGWSRLVSFRASCSCSLPAKALVFFIGGPKRPFLAIPHVLNGEIAGFLCLLKKGDFYVNFCFWHSYAPEKSVLPHRFSLTPLRI